MDLSTREVRALIRFAKQEGASFIKIGEIEVHFTFPNMEAPSRKAIEAAGSPSSPSIASPSDLEQTIRALNQSDPVPTDEDLQFWSAGGLLPSEARELQKKQHPNPEEVNGKTA